MPGPVGVEPEALLALVKAAPVPEHVAVIMDGNGRWATRRGLPRVAGHREGVKTVRAVVRAAGSAGVRYLTLYAFSTENWARPAEEVSFLMRLLEDALDRELAELMANNVRLRVIGSPGRVPDGVRAGVERIARATAANTGLTVVMAFNYGARGEIVEACRALARRVAAGELAAEAISEEVLASALSTAGIPDPALLIRTSGEMRLSNFLLWQVAYTELWVTEILWPDFGEADFYRALLDFQGRNRRFGGI